MEAKQILMIGSDLHTNGGIASVVKCYHKTFERNHTQFDFNFILLRTYYYKDKGLLFELFIFIKALIVCVWLLLFRHVDVVHIHSSAGISFARKTFFVFLARLFGKKTILHLHASRFYDFFLTSQPLKRFWINTVFTQADMVITLCSDWETKIREYYPKVRVTTIHNPVDLADNDFVPAKERKNALHVIFVGFLIPSKGIADLLQVALRFAQNSHPGVRFSIAGKGEMEEDILNFISEHDLEENISYLGWVSGKDKEALYQSADVFFLPSYKEGMPMSILEAMRYSLPIISTNIAGIPDLVSEGANGYMLQPGDVEGYYQKLKLLAEDSALLRSFRKESYARVQGFDTRKILKEVENTYDVLLDENGQKASAPNIPPA